ncbi:MAG: O-methyltransferase [Bacteroidales bacterium]
MKEPSYLVDAKLEAYAESMSEPREDLLYQLYRETNMKVLRPRMLTGHIQGHFLQFLSQLIRPHTILEVGTFTGYGTICLSKGLAKCGKIYTIEKNPEVLDYAKKYFELAGIQENVTIYEQDALEVLSQTKMHFDMAFVDGDKSEYPDYIQLISPRINSGGLLLIDNALWEGKVTSPTINDKETIAIRKTNEMIREDQTFSNMLLPLRDGLMVARKI